MDPNMVYTLKKGLKNSKKICLIWMISYGKRKVELPRSKRIIVSKYYGLNYAIYKLEKDLKRF